MKRQFTEYLRAIKFPDNFDTRVEEILTFYEKYLEITIDDIFITDHIDKEGERFFENLWLMNSDLVMEAKNFLKQDDFDCFSFYIMNWAIKKDEYDPLKGATDNSRLNVTISMGGGAGGAFRASRENCDYLMDLFLKYINKVGRRK